MNMAGENQFLLHSLMMGAFILFVYDILRVIRRVIPHGWFWVAVEDLVFWFYCGAEVFLLMYHESNGTLRWFAVLGALAGMLCYKKAVSPLLVKYVSILLAKALTLLGTILRWLSRPFRFAGKRAGSAVHKSGGRIRRRMKKIGRAVKFRLTFFLKVFKINLKA